METINRMNKAEMGMNRNDFYAYKKQRALELAQNGASVEDIAADLGLGDKDMYAFLSRNFGGIRRMRQMNTTMGVPNLMMASMPIQEQVSENKSTQNAKSEGAKSNTSNKKGKVKGVSPSPFFNLLSTEKEKILSQFRKDVEKDSQTVIADLQKRLNEQKTSMLKKFKDELMHDLSTLSANL